MDSRRLALLPPLCLACFVLAGCALSTGSASSQRIVASNAACDVEAVFDGTAELARELAPLEAEYSRDGSCDAAKVEVLQSETDDLRELLAMANHEPTHDVSSETLADALSLYAEGLIQLDRDLENADMETGVEGIQQLQRAEDLRGDARDQLLDEGFCN